MAKTLQYWGTGNFQEHPYTGRIVTWTEKEKQTVDDAIATKLLASGAGFVLDNDETGEVVTSRIDPVTGGISLTPSLHIPGLSYTFNGTRSAPVSTFDGALTNGIPALPQPILIPASMVTAGESATEVRIVLRKIGTGTGGWSLKFGPTNGLGDADISPAIGTSFSATDPLEFILTFRLTYSSGKVFCTGNRGVASTSFNVDGKETSVNIGVDNYLNVALNTFSSGTSVALVSFDVQHFR